MTTTGSFTHQPGFEAVVIGLCCFALVVATAAMHYEALRALDRGLAAWAATLRRRIAALVFGLFVLHAAEVAVYALAIFLMARHAGMGTLGISDHPSFSVALYFSLETYSSLGYGDVVPSGALRMMAGAEALDGLLLIGWSASYLHITMDRYWRTVP